MTDYATLAEISQAAYSTTANSQSINGYSPIAQDFDLNFWSNGTGFTTHAYYSSDDNTLVVAFAGTTSGLDYLTDAQLAAVGQSNQDNLALNFTSSAVNLLAAQGINGYNIVYTGHSLGGYLAQVAGIQNSGASIVVFNSPGVGGIFGDATLNENTTYVFSNPESWGFVDGLIHNTVDLQSYNVVFLQGADGHPIASIVDGLCCTNLLRAGLPLSPDRLIP